MVITKKTSWPTNDKLKFQLLSLSSDLGRIALSIHRGSFEVASRFCDSGLTFCTLDNSLPQHIRQMLISLQAELSTKRITTVDGERYLVRSIQLHNFAIKKL